MSELQLSLKLNKMNGNLNLQNEINELNIFSRFYH